MVFRTTVALAVQNLHHTHGIPSMAGLGHVQAKGWRSACEASTGQSGLGEQGAKDMFDA